ncbi:4'-phosphopantetheinyl transferase family protein [Spongisporangium articulatum]|uniref:4'-phosphopantetheinyl transferase family protein n=1 Tax=Spongisporangium articulatum TaxID=3362603 RepID=A0ABW8AIK9_9ACTN
MDVELFWAAVDAGRLSESTRASLRLDVDPDRLAKLGRFVRAEDRDRGLAAHALLRRVLADRLDVRPAELVFETFCAACGEVGHGKPSVVGAPVEFNLSHSGERVVVALAPAGVPVGVDVETRRGVDWAGLRRQVFTDAEWARTGAHPDPDAERTRTWARKEAAVKAVGHGLAMPLRTVETRPLEGLRDAAGPVWSVDLPQGAGRLDGTDVDLGGYPGAVAVAGDPPQWRLRAHEAVLA